MDSLLLNPHQAHQIPQNLSSARLQRAELPTAHAAAQSHRCQRRFLAAPTQEVYFDDGCFLPGYGGSFAGSALRGFSEPGAEGRQLEGSGSCGQAVRAHLLHAIRCALPCA